MSETPLNNGADPSDDTAARIGEAERERALHTLSHHVGTGRLSLTEFEARSTIAAAATTRGELARVLVDLPIPLTAAPAPDARALPATGVVAAAVLVLTLAATLTTGNWWWVALLCVVPAYAAYRHTR